MFSNFIFEIRSDIFIILVILKILIKSIIFYIVPVNTLFLLYKVDIDNLKAFFKNINN